MFVDFHALILGVIYSTQHVIWKEEKRAENIGEMSR